MVEEMVVQEEVEREEVVNSQQVVVYSQQVLAVPTMAVALVEKQVEDSLVVQAVH